jgi:hypothetical protein
MSMSVQVTVIASASHGRCGGTGADGAGLAGVVPVGVVLDAATDTTAPQ